MVLLDADLPRVGICAKSSIDIIPYIYGLIKAIPYNNLDYIKIYVVHIHRIFGAVTEYSGHVIRENIRCSDVL